MKTRRIFATAWEGLTLNKVRSFLTTLGVIIGVASVIIMLAISAGTEATSSHVPKSIFRPCSAASDTPIGLAEVAVSHSADETARLAMPQNIR